MTSDPISRYRLTRAERLRETETLRPMKASETMDLALRICQRLGSQFLRVTAIPCLLCLSSVAFVYAYVLPNITVTSNSQSIPTQTLEFVIAILVTLLVAVPVFLLGLAFGSTAVIRMTADLIEGRPVDPDRAVAESRKVLPAMFRLWLFELLVCLSAGIVGVVLMIAGAMVAQYTPESDSLPGILSGIGVLALLAEGAVVLFMLQRNGVVGPVAVIEGLNGSKAGKRSNQLLRSAPIHGSGQGIVGNIFGIILLCSIAILGSSAFVIDTLDLSRRIEHLLSHSVVLLLAQTLLGLVGPYLALWSMIPFWASALTVAYYERRIRLEGFDIDALASQIPERCN